MNRRKWLVNTLRNNIQSFPLPRDFKVLTDIFHDEATDPAICCDISSDK
jgi:hypothetical protein